MPSTWYVHMGLDLKKSIVLEICLFILPPRIWRNTLLHGHMWTPDCRDSHETRSWLAGFQKTGLEWPSAGFAFRLLSVTKLEIISSTSSSTKMKRNICCTGPDSAGEWTTRQAVKRLFGCNQVSLRRKCIDSDWYSSLLGCLYISPLSPPPRSDNQLTELMFLPWTAHWTLPSLLNNIEISANVWSHFFPTKFDGDFMRHLPAHPKAAACGQGFGKRKQHISPLALAKHISIVVEERAQVRPNTAFTDDVRNGPNVEEPQRLYVTFSEQCPTSFTSNVQTSGTFLAVSRKKHVAMPSHADS